MCPCVFLDFFLWQTIRAEMCIRDRHHTNSSTLGQLRIKKRLSPKARRISLKYFGHLIRKTNVSVKLIILGNVKEKRSRGRGPTRWLAHKESMIVMGVHEAEQVAEYREAWRIATEAAPS